MRAANIYVQLENKSNPGIYRYTETSGDRTRAIVILLPVHNASMIQSRPEINVITCVR